MTRLLLVVGAIFALIFVPAWAESADSPSSAPAPSPLPSVRLIKPRSGKPDARPATVSRPPTGPLDERCRPLKQALELQLRQQGKARKAFQAQLAHNAGTRLCREGHPEKGMAEFRKGLSYLEDTHRP